MNGDLKISELGAELEHHGVKGMKWGRRKAKTSSSSVDKHSSRKRAIAAEVAGVAAVGGVALAIHLVSKHSGTKVKSIKLKDAEGFKNLIEKHGKEAYDAARKSEATKNALKYYLG